MVSTRSDNTGTFALIIVPTMPSHQERMDMNVAAAARNRPLGTFGQGLSGFLLAVAVHEFTWGLSALALWVVSPLAAVVGGFAVAAGACAVAYDAVRLPAVRKGMRTYFWLISAVLVAAIVVLVFVL